MTQSFWFPVQFRPLHNSMLHDGSSINYLPQAVPDLKHRGCCWVSQGSSGQSQSAVRLWDCEMARRENLPSQHWYLVAFVPWWNKKCSAAFSLNITGLICIHLIFVLFNHPIQWSCRDWRTYAALLSFTCSSAVPIIVSVRWFYLSFVDFTLVYICSPSLPLCVPLPRNIASLRHWETWNGIIPPPSVPSLRL